MPFYPHIDIITGIMTGIMTGILTDIMTRIISVNDFLLSRMSLSPHSVKIDSL